MELPAPQVLNIKAHGMFQPARRFSISRFPFPRSERATKNLVPLANVVRFGEKKQRLCPLRENADEFAKSTVTKLENMAKLAKLKNTAAEKSNFKGNKKISLSNWRVASNLRFDSD